jgi:hypothetical protein
MKNEPDESVLADDHPVHEGYLYVINDEAISSPLEGTIADLKRLFKVAEVRRCDIAWRELWDEAL